MYRHTHCNTTRRRAVSSGSAGNSDDTKRGPGLAERDPALAASEAPVDAFGSISGRQHGNSGGISSSSNSNSSSGSGADEELVGDLQQLQRSLRDSLQSLSRNDSIVQGRTAALSTDYAEVKKSLDELSAHCRDSSGRVAILATTCAEVEESLEEAKSQFPDVDGGVGGAAGASVGPVTALKAAIRRLKSECMEMMLRSGLVAAQLIENKKLGSFGRGDRINQSKGRVERRGRGKYSLSKSVVRVDQDFNLDDEEL